MFTQFRTTTPRRGAQSQDVISRSRQGLSTAFADIDETAIAGPSRPLPLFLPSQSQESIGEWPADFMPPPGMVFHSPIGSFTREVAPPRAPTPAWDSSFDWPATPTPMLLGTPHAVTPRPRAPSPALSIISWVDSVAASVARPRSPSVAASAASTAGPVRNTGNGKFRFSSSKYFLTYSQVSYLCNVRVCANFNPDR
jgi:hypothetical protein